MQNESIEELVDLLEVINAIIEYKGFDKSELQQIKENKADKKGKFKNRIILDES